MSKTPPSPLTPEFCRSNRLVFYPKTLDEVNFIQERLAEFGIRWADGKPVGALAQECLNKGMLVENAKLYYNPVSNDRSIQCTAGQFNGEYISPDRAFLLEPFNKMAERIDALSSRVAELEKKVGETHQALFPAVDDTKPKLRRLP